MVSVMEADSFHLLYMCVPLGLVDTCRHISHSYMAVNFLNSSGGGKVHLRQGCTSSGSHLAVATTFCTVKPIICGFSTWNSLHFSLLANGCYEVRDRLFENVLVLYFKDQLALEFVRSLNVL